MRHLIFIFVDHFEPQRAEHVAAWVERYPAVADAFADADGVHPQHTWFYDGDTPEVLEALGGLCGQRLGEIELHLHHSYDTPDGLREKLERRKEVYAQHGALLTSGAKPVKTFGFIHGKWSLDNSRGDACCGVNNELQVLREAGCYADFTFPAWGRMQPGKCSSIYYATDDPERAKSYDTGTDVEVGRGATGDLMIVQGPGGLSGVPARAARVPGVAWLADRVWLTCAVEAHLPPTLARVERWVRANVHVKGRPEWVFVKVHTHGARPESYGSYFSRNAQMLHGCLTTRFNDGVEWKLHYATAREAYNIIKAAEAGKTGDPNDFRDYLLLPYQNRG